jgi:hypothetical protein
MSGDSRIIEHNVVVSQAANPDGSRQVRRPWKRHRPAQGDRIAGIEPRTSRDPTAIDISAVARPQVAQQEAMGQLRQLAMARRRYRRIDDDIATRTVADNPGSHATLFRDDPWEEYASSSLKLQQRSLNVEWVFPPTAGRRVSRQRPGVQGISAIKRYIRN